MTEETKVLMKLLLALGMSELFTRTIAGALKTQEDTKKMLVFLKNERPTTEQPIVEELARIRHYH